MKRVNEFIEHLRSRVQQGAFHHSQRRNMGTCREARNIPSRLFELDIVFDMKI